MKIAAAFISVLGAVGCEKPEKCNGRAIIDYTGPVSECQLKSMSDSQRHAYCYAKAQNEAGEFGNGTEQDMTDRDNLRTDIRNGCLAAVSRYMDKK